MTGSILGWGHTNDGCAQTQEHSIKRVNQTLLKPEIPEWKENWHRAFLRFGCALRWRSGCCRITTDSISKPTQMKGEGRQKVHWMKVVRMKVVRIRVVNTSVLFSLLAHYVLEACELRTGCLNSLCRVFGVVSRKNHIS